MRVKRNIDSFAGGISRVLFAALLLFLAALPLQAQGRNRWKSTRIVPGASILASGKVIFKECFVANNSGFDGWHKCSDPGHRHLLNWKSVWPQVHRDIDFTLNKPGYVYLLFTSRVDKTWAYGGCTAVISKRGLNGKWQNVWFGEGLRSALFRGGKLVNTSPNISRTGPPSLLYRIAADGKIQFRDSIPRFSSGNYRLTVTEGMFHNMNTAVKTYFPSRAEYKLVFVPDRPVSTVGGAVPAAPAPHVTGVVHTGATNTWVVNQAGNVYRLNKKWGWTFIPGKKAKDVGVGANGSVWIVGTSPVYGGFAIYRWMKTRFVRVDGGAVRIDVGPDGLPWVVNSMHDIYRRVKPHWERMPGKAMDIGIGANGAVWIIGTNRLRGGYGIFRWNGHNWHRVPGAAVRIDVDAAGNPWVVNDAGGIYKWTGNKWNVLPGLGKDITVGGGSEWVIGTDSVPGGHGIYKWDTRIRNWKRIPGGAVDISTGGWPHQLKPVSVAPEARFNLKSGKYKVETRVGGNLYSSIWTLRVRNGKITGFSSWPCCPGPRNDPVRGKIKGNSVVIQRDCSGQGWKGGCIQTYAGKVNGNRIEGTATGTGLSGHKTTWTLFLDTRVPFVSIRRRR